MKTQAAESPKDENDYEAIITNCSLFVKLAQMTDPLYRSLHPRFEKEDIKYHYRKIICNAFGLPAGNQQFTSGNLFPDS